MSVRVALRHTTHYRFDRLVGLAPHVIRLRPAPHCRTSIPGYSLSINPRQHFINWQQDPFGNWLARVVFLDQTRELIVEVEVIAELTTINPFDFFVEPSAEMFPFQYSDDLARDLMPYLEITETSAGFMAWLETVDVTPCSIVEYLVTLNRQVQREIRYQIRMEHGVQTCDETLKTKSGSCRDSAWLLVQVLRHLGLAARFVSGYLVQLSPVEIPLTGHSGSGADVTDLHAWAEVYLPGAGWIGLDPTSGLFASEGHIPLAATPRPSRAAPIEGVTDKCEVAFHFSNVVSRIADASRVNKPLATEYERP